MTASEKIVMVSDVTYGGAAIACRRLRDAFLLGGASAQWVASSGGKMPGCHVLDSWPSLTSLIFQRVCRCLSVSSKHSDRYVRAMESRRIAKAVFALSNVGAVNLHNVHARADAQLLSLLLSKVPLVLTLHDMWYLTGGCTHSLKCEQFIHGCAPKEGGGICCAAPEVSEARPDWSILEKVYSQWSKKIAIVAPSKWLCCKAEQRMQGRIPTYRIANPLDLSVFSPRASKAEARACLGLPKDGKLILTSSHWLGDQMKGMQILADAGHLLRNAGRKFSLVALGERYVGDEVGDGWILSGLIRDEITLSIYYRAADVFVLPSLAENYPNTLCESLACGTPVVSFDVGGCAEINIHGKTGSVAKSTSSIDLAEAIDEILTADVQKSSTYAGECRAYAERELNPHEISSAYRRVIKQLMSSS
jgi:glycosyltransferase involved in cell wall biosynthesis